MNHLVTWRYEFAIIADWFVGSDCGLTTSLTIYGFGLRGNSANESIGKHRFRTKKHQKVNKSSQKTMAYLFGTLILQDRIFFSQNRQKSLETSGFQGFSIFSKKCQIFTSTTCFDHLWKTPLFLIKLGISLRLKSKVLFFVYCVSKFDGWNNKFSLYSYNAPFIFRLSAYRHDSFSILQPKNSSNGFR